MSKDKFSNGAWKNTTKQQDVTSQVIFKTLKDTNNLESMSCDFSQYTGLCNYHYNLPDNKVYSITVNREGEITNCLFSGYHKIGILSI